MNPLPADYDEMAKFSQWAVGRVPDHETAALDCALLDALVDMRTRHPCADNQYLWAGWLYTLGRFIDTVECPVPNVPLRDTSARDSAAVLVRDALALLPTPLRRVVSTHALCGCTTKETATRLGLSPAKVKLLYEQGIKELRCHGH